MDCLAVQKDLDDLDAGRLNAARADSVRAHLAACPACRAFVADTACLRMRLASEPLPPVPESLRRRLHEPAVIEPAPLLRPLLIAAGLIAVLGVSLMLGPWRKQSAPLADGVAARTEQTVTLALDAVGDMPGVTLRLVLPPGAEVAGHPGLTELEWQEDLIAGVNRLRIPLLLNAGTEGVLVARIESQGRSRELRVPLVFRQGAFVKPNRG